MSSQEIAPPAAASTCPSCGAPIDASYCAACGERAPRRITFRGAFVEARDQLLGLDFRIVRTARALLADPGDLLRGYLDGRRAGVTNPFKFLFVTATLYVLVVTLLDVQVSYGPGAQESAIVIAALINYLVFLFLLPASAVLWALFRSGGRNWAETYVALCFVWGGYLLLAAALGAAMAAVDRWYFPARTLLGYVFISFCVRSFYRTTWPAALLKSALFYLAYFLLTFGLMTSFIFLSVLAGWDLFGIAPVRGGG